jgi:hypothetical protein
VRALESRRLGKQPYSPTAKVLAAVWPVSGLANAAWLTIVFPCRFGHSDLGVRRCFAYRCGGSAGIECIALAPASRFTRLELAS